jgi:putative transposase
MDEAQLFAEFMELVDNALPRGESRMATWELIHEAYNAGQIAPELRRLKGRRSERALRNWYSEWKKEKDMFAIVHGNSSRKKGRNVTEFEQCFLLNILLDPNQVSIGSAITYLKDYCRVEGIDSPTSRSTLRRWINDWINTDDNKANWTLARMGTTQVQNFYIKSIQRNDKMLKVGDVIVGDGHVLANDIISPVDGKRRRMTLIMFYDWASRYPVGASLSLTENSVHILTALRAAILQLGFTPKFVYLDNGRAFKSKLFHKKAEEHDLSKELAGIMPRLGIVAHFAQAYNARSKNIERFFRTLQDQWERFCAGFRGSNISNKPAPLQRNEKWAQRMYDQEPMTYQEAMEMIDYWVRYYYGGRGHSSLAGKTPWEVFEARAIPADRVISQHKLDILMLVAVRKNVSKEGIMLSGMRYYHSALIDYVGKPVVIRYDYADLRSILVYDTNSHFICQADMRESQHAFAAIALAEGDPIPMEKVKKEHNENLKAVRQIEKNTKKLVMENKEKVDAYITQMQKEKAEKQPKHPEENRLFPKYSPVIKPQKPETDVHDIVRRLEEEVAQAKEDNEIAAEKGAESDGGYDAAVGFDELLELTGIKHGGKRR